jgi:hypothetical protein
MFNIATWLQNKYGRIAPSLFGSSLW